MNYVVITADSFRKDAKKLLKKYPSLADEIEALINDLEENPTFGTPLGQDCYKIRLAIKSKNKGKSGGARVITNVKIVKETVFLLSIYDKSEKIDISSEELNDWLLGL
jgi:mRNA-degrading endonuclease RelE of RelBE toxin-antitoxin system